MKVPLSLNFSVGTFDIITMGTRAIPRYSSGYLKKISPSSPGISVPYKVCGDVVTIFADT